jgi:hypothetical protein
VPATYVPGQVYPLKISVSHPGQTRWGFELSARFANSGQQAGKLVSTDQMTQVKESDNIQYIEHTLAGTRAETVNGPVEFQFNWVAPESSNEMVLFNAAGNAANNSNSPAGDFIYTAGAWSSASGVPLSTMAIPKPEEEKKWGERLVEASKVVDLPAPIHLRKGAFQFNVQHRFFEALADSSAGDAFGIDSGASVNLAVNYGISDRFSMGVSRARTLTNDGIGHIIAWTGTYEIQTRSDSLWKMALLASVEGEHDFKRQFSPSLQLATSVDFKGVRLYAVPTMVFHSRSRDVVNRFGSRVINPDDSNTFSLGLGGDIAISRRFSVVGEIVPRLAGFGGVDHHRPTISGGVEIRTWKHVFNVLVSSSREFTPAKYAVNPGQKDVSLGFNIYRLFR